LFDRPGKYAAARDLVSAPARCDAGNERDRHPYLCVLCGYDLSVTVADDTRPRRDYCLMSWTDKELGMDRSITRRDFMNGAAMAVAAAITPHSGLFAQAVPGPQDRPGYDP